MGRTAGKKTKAPRVRKPQPTIVFRVNYCPHCGEHFNNLRQECIAIFQDCNLTPKYPRNVCAQCGLKRNEVTIHFDS